MYSRAHLLILRDFEKLKEDKIWGIEAYQLKDDNVFEWTAKILGLKGTLWEGGILRVYIKFDEHYNTRPPQLCFHTIPFHPNVDMITGQPCVEFLDDWSKWNKSYTISSLLLTIQVMLSNPVLENAVNLEAVNMLVNSPQKYKQMMLDCVAASQRVEAGLVPHMIETGKVQIASLRPPKTPPAKAPTPATTPQRRAHIAFEDYYTTWRGIATSKSTSDSINPLLEAIKENPALQAAHYCLPVKDIQVQMEQQLQEHSQLVYGKFKDNNLTDAQLKEAKLEKVNQMRKIYMRPKTSSRRTPISLYEGGPENTRVGDEHWEEEVDNLVAWTNNLNADAL
ncbi:hypothetical protein LSH36_173g09005 [Paralvinella palmiformis]|uniref:UBC core domain-containing protein n=1 Tax=Paralvinella palmiformis TaxID=53620 RepID=A0AAD9JSS1_9ANNE|nr:hypothetical protein LSH36_173g09005 [Paralvinella palmiformis]